ncbi:MAG TPA: hypothetical protein VGA95_13565 [Thermodesulfobacteriota bacterium]
MKDKNALTMEEKLAAYIEGTLSEEEKAIIDGQLKESEEMRESLSDLRKTIQILQGAEKVETPKLFTEQIISRVREEALQKKGMFERFFSPLHTKLPIQAFAAIFLVALSIFIYKAYKPELDRIRSNQAGIPTQKQPQPEEIWGDIKITAYVKDIDIANKETQTTITNLGGIILRKQSFEGKNILFVLLDLKRVNELYEGLKPIGEVEEEGELRKVKGDVKIKIEILKK